MPPAADSASHAGTGVADRPQPSDMPFVELLKRALARMKEQDVTSLADAVAFRIFLSLFPGAVAAVAIFSLVGDPAALLERAEGVVPPAVASLLEERVLALADTQGAGLIAAAGVLGGLWAASSAATTVMRALNRLYGIPEERGFVARRLTALAITLALFVALAALVALVVLGPQLQALLLPDELLGGAAGPVFRVLQFLAALLVLVLLFAFIYWIGPNGPRPRWEWWSPGALIGVLGWLVVSALFSLYTQTAAAYEATYAGLAGVIVTLVWLQLSMVMLLFGAAVNAERRRLRAPGSGVDATVTTASVEAAGNAPATVPPPAGRPVPAIAPRRAVLAATAAVAAAVAAVVTAWRGRRRA